jgi:asparagine synthase (glutamine-hydrolysing)
MCGIVGAFAFSSSADPVDQAIVLRLNDLQRRRGPDGAGVWSSGNGRVVLGHRRLAIIDTGVSGHQPMSDVTGRWVISFNGEIYNYRALRLDLERLGCIFQTNSDTEVLINAVARWGEAGLQKLRGMYAFALWDGLEQELWLARDPYGIKPLYVSENLGTLWFASQARSLSNCAPVDTRRDAAALVGFHLWGHVPEPFSWWAGVRMLPAGHVQRIRAGKPTGAPSTFYRIEDKFAKSSAEPLHPGELRDLLIESVRHHLVSDVPVGVFLSAGVDSSVIASLAAEAGTRVRTITVGFSEYIGTHNDEVPIAETTAKALGSDHVTVRVSRDEFEGLLDDFLLSMDQPTIDGLNTYLVSRAAASQGIKVVLSGLGGDELFGGYPSFRQIPTLLRWGRYLAPHSLGRVTQLGLRAMAVPGIPPKVAGLLSHSGDVTKAYLLRRALRLEQELDSLLDAELLRNGLERLSTQSALAATIAPLNQSGASVYAKVAVLEACWYMRNQLLRDTDWSSMAHSLEVRLPFVDLRLLERIGACIGSDMPPSKRDLAACAGRLPDEVWHRKKTGFITPVREWSQELCKVEARGLTGWASFVAAQFDAPLDPARPAPKRNSKDRGFGMRPATKAARSRREPILIFRIGSIGDTVIALPCFHLIARAFPNVRRIVLTNTPVSVKAAPLESVLDKSGLIDNVIHFSPSTRSLRELAELRKRIRKTGARTLIYMSPRSPFGVIRDMVFFRSCGIRRIIGAPLARNLRVTQIDPATRMVEREAERLARCLAPLGNIAVHDRTLWDLRLLPEEMETADKIVFQLGGASFVAINLGGKVPRNNWGDARWTELLRLMAHKYAGFALVLFGSEDEFDRSARIAAKWSGPTLNLCGKLSPRESAAVMRRATLFVGHDSGPMHLASAVGIPCVAMFGDFNPPKKWHPFGEEHRLIHNMLGVGSISPEEVYLAVHSVITRRAALETPKQSVAVG